MLPWEVMKYAKFNHSLVNGKSMFCLGDEIKIALKVCEKCRWAETLRFVLGEMRKCLERVINEVTRNGFDVADT